MSTARPIFLNDDNERFTSMLTVLLGKLSSNSLAIKHAPVNDLSLSTLISNAATTLQLLHIDNCPRLPTEGVLVLANHCRYLQELDLPYSSLNDELLMALSSEQHIRLKTFRVEAHPETKPHPHVSIEAWSALRRHSPSINLILLSYLAEEDHHNILLESYISMTHLYFGDNVSTTILTRISEHCPRLVELIISAHGPNLIDQALISIAQGCPQLTAVGLGDCELTCSSLVEFVTRCGVRLQEFYVWETSLLEDSKFDVVQTTANVSLILGRNWTPEYVPMW